MPAGFQIGGPRRFPGALADPRQSWVLVPPARPGAGAAIRTQSDSLAGGYMILPGFQAGEGWNAASHGSLDHPELLGFSWDWVECRYSPLPGLAVEAVHWCPDARLVCGSLGLRNTSSQEIPLTLDLRCQGSRGGQASRFSPEYFQGRQITAGAAGDQQVALFLSGGTASPSGSSCLRSAITLPPNGKQELRWIFATASSRAELLNCLQAAIELDWPGEISHRRIQAASQLQVRTGDPDWDLALRLNHKQAWQVFQQLCNSSPGNTAPLSSLQAWQLYQALPDLDSRESLQLLGWLDLQESPDAADLPLAAELVWQASQDGLPAADWKGLLPGLEAWLGSWFGPDRDRDGDGIPELAEAEMPLEHPGLAALLYNELGRLEELLAALPGGAPSPLADRQGDLLAYLGESWSSSEGRFRSRDHLTHLSGPGAVLAREILPGWNVPWQTLPRPSRLVLSLELPPEGDLNANRQIILHGRDWRGRSRVEEIPASLIRWKGRQGRALTESVFSALHYCLASGLEPGASLEIALPPADREDLQSAFALWGPVLGEEELERCLARGLAPYRREYGLAANREDAPGEVQLTWNLLAAQALLRRGRPALARQLFQDWLKGLLVNLRLSGDFYPVWDAGDGRGSGAAGWIEGLLPIRLLLASGGIRLLPGGRLAFDPGGDQQGEIGIQWRGVEVRSQAGRLLVQRPGAEAREIRPEGAGEIQLFDAPSENISTW